VRLGTVRQKVKELIALVQDDDALRVERKKAKKNKDKYIGMSGGLSGQHYCEFCTAYCVCSFCFVIVTSVKEVMFLSDFVCLSVCV